MDSKKTCIAMSWAGKIILVPLFAVGPVFCAIIWDDYHQKWVELA